MKKCLVIKRVIVLAEPGSEVIITDEQYNLAKDYLDFVPVGVQSVATEAVAEKEATEEAAEEATEEATEEVIPDFENMKKPELVVLASQRGIDTEGLTKAEIIERLEGG